MNPRDIMTDAIHNFHPQYQQYTQYSSDNKRFQNKGTGGDKGDNLNTSTGRREGQGSRIGFRTEKNAIHIGNV